MTIDRRHMPFLFACLGGVAGLAIFSVLKLEATIVGAVNLFFVIYLALTAVRVPRLTASYLKANAAATDEPAAIIFLITFGTVLVSLGCLFILINESGTPDRIDLVLSLVTVALGWFTIHTMAALHYAHLYWRPEDTEANKKHRGGLEFPGGTQPGAYDFLYFSFVTGMTAQTSDVAITGTAMRKFNLVHGIVSFFFNTVLVAAAVNVAVSLAT